MKARQDFNSEAEWQEYIRTYFAAMAMQGLLSANPTHLHGNIELPVASEVAKSAIDYADSLITELNKAK